MDGAASSAIFLFGDFRLDRRTGGLFRRDERGAVIPVAIGSRALDVLGVLVARAGDLVSKDEIMVGVWSGMVVEDSNLTVQISALRRVLDQGRAEGSCIQTVAGRGYRFVAAVTAALEKTVAPAVPSAAPRLSIVVLPFANLSPDPEHQYFADGFTEDLTHDLSRIEGSFVISRNTAFTYRNKPVDTKEIGRELGVRYVLEGTVRRSGKQVRVNAQLIDAETDAQSGRSALIATRATCSPCKTRSRAESRLHSPSSWSAPRPCGRPPIPRRWTSCCGEMPQRRSRHHATNMPRRSACTSGR
jgi:TolB-like protein